MMTALQELFLDKYNPHREQSIDEAMIPFQGRSSLKQYLPAKPIKRGIKVWCRADPHNGYLSELQVYTGRAGSGGRQHNLGERVVLDLSRKLEGLHYHMYFDNYFTSVSLLSSLLSKGLYGCGTARQSYVGFPDALHMCSSSKRPIIGQTNIRTAAFHKQRDVIVSFRKENFGILISSMCRRYERKWL